MSSYEGQVVKIVLVFHALYFKNEVGDPPIFGISDINNSLSNCNKSMKKICVVEDFCPNVLKRCMCSLITFYHVQYYINVCVLCNRLSVLILVHIS